MRQSLKSKAFNLLARLTKNYFTADGLYLGSFAEKGGAEQAESQRAITLS
jgi:hypothetical protein